MSNKLGSLIAMLGAGMGGYAQGAQVRRNNERQDRLDAQQQENYDFEKGQREKQAKLEGDVSGAMADRTVENVTPPDISNADITMAGLQTPQYRVGDQTYADEGQARMALQGVNSQAEKYKRAAAAAAASGSLAGTDRAQVYDALAKKALNEGTDQILGHIQKSAPTLEALKAAGGKMAGTIAPEAADVFNTTGSRWRVTPDAQVVHYIDKDATGREFVNSRVLDSQGVPVVNDVKHAGLFLQDYKTRMESDANDTRAYQTGQQIAQTGKRDEEASRHNQAGETEQHIANQNQYRVGMAGVGVQQARLNLEQGKDKREASLFKSQTLDGQVEEMEKAFGPMTPDDKKAFRRAKMGLTGKDAGKNIDALVDHITEKYGETNADPAAIATFRANLSKNMTAAANNDRVAGTLQGEFAKNPFGTPGYPQVYNDAKTQLGMTDAALQQMGYKPPPAAGAAKAARGVIPSPPDERVWSGNEYIVNPAYADWDQKYGASARAQSGATQQRLISGYERAHD